MRAWSWYSFSILIMLILLCSWCSRVWFIENSDSLSLLSSILMILRAFLSSTFSLCNYFKPIWANLIYFKIFSIDKSWENCLSVFSKSLLRELFSFLSNKNLKHLSFWVKNNLRFRWEVNSISVFFVFSFLNWILELGFYGFFFLVFY